MNLLITKEEELLRKKNTTQLKEILSPDRNAILTNHLINA
jgi:hypothetical protein